MLGTRGARIKAGRKEAGAWALGSSSVRAVGVVPDLYIPPLCSRSGKANELNA